VKQLTSEQQTLTRMVKEIEATYLQKKEENKDITILISEKKNYISCNRVKSAIPGSQSAVTGLEIASNKFGPTVLNMLLPYLSYL
jgi:hypothetical protein